MSTGIDAAKQAIRTQVWDVLERERAVEPGVHGYIPAFAGADAAADRLAHLPVWQAAQVIKAVPDGAQQPVRERALQDAKLLYMAVPMLADDPPFYVLDPASLTVPPQRPRHGRRLPGSPQRSPSPTCGRSTSWSVAASQ